MHVDSFVVIDTVFDYSKWETPIDAMSVRRYCCGHSQNRRYLGDDSRNI